MSSLIHQMNELQKQQNILAKQIRQEEERQAKLNMEASITRLEELIKPITQELDWIPTNTHELRTTREKINHSYDLQRNEAILCKQRRAIPSKLNRQWNIVGCEEIFVTLLGIIKKQEARINKLESQYLRNE